jgi:hypothetical protein
MAGKLFLEGAEKSFFKQWASLKSYLPSLIINASCQTLLEAFPERNRSIASFQSRSQWVLARVSEHFWFDTFNQLAYR